MPRAYHNLDGALRDIEAAYRAEDGDGAQRWQRWCDVVEWAMDAIDGGAGDVPEGNSTSSEDELDSDDPSSSWGDGEEPRRHAERGNSVRPSASLLDRALDGLAGEERAQAVAELDSLRSNAMAAPRLTAEPEVCDGKKPPTRPKR